MIAYILKSSLSLLLLFGLYWFILRREKLFVFNRYFLLFSILLSLVLPFISIPVNIQAKEAQNNIFTLLNGNSPAINYNQNPLPDNTKQYVEADSSAETLPSKIGFSQILLLIYILGLILALSRFTKNIYSIYRQIKLSESVNFSDRKLVLVDNQINPYCFFNTIFVCKQDYLNNKIAKEFLAHELEHIRQSHSTDIILLELIRIVYWFNPILSLYSRAIRVNHEYLADNGVLRDSPDIENYADKLLSLIGYKETIPLTSSLNHSLMKRRLLMITKPESKSITYGLRITLTLSMIIVFFLFLSFKPSEAQPDNSLINHEDATNRLLIAKDSIESSKPVLNPETQSSNIFYKKATFTSSGYVKNDTINQTIVLVDNAILRLGEITIKADSIVFNTRTHQIFATGRQDGSGTIIGKPFFKEGSQEMEADEITYNLNTRKAFVKNVKVQVNIKLKDSSTIWAPASNKEYDSTNNATLNKIEKPELFPIKKGEYKEIPVPFGEKRIKLNSKTDTVMFHYGIDINAKFGTEVMATAGGKVIIASWEKGENWSYGNLIMVDHGDGCQSVYAHLKDFSVKNGDIVKKGQIIGHVGSSGLSTDAHLHFEIRIKGERVNPLTYLK